MNDRTRILSQLSDFKAHPEIVDKTTYSVNLEDGDDNCLYTPCERTLASEADMMRVSA